MIITEKKISIVVVLASVLVGLYLVAPIFKGGFVMNEDLPSRFGAAACFSKGPFHLLPHAWCSQIQAGIAPMQGYQPGYAHLVAVLDWFLPIGAAFKAGLVVVYFSLPAAALWLWWRMSMPLAGALSFAFLVVEQGSILGGGYTRLFEYGGIGFSLGLALSLVCLGCAVSFFERPSWRGLSVLSVWTALYGVTYPSMVVTFSIPLVILFLTHRKSVRGRLLLEYAVGYVFLVLLLVSYWFIPFLSTISGYVFNPPQALSLSELSAQFISHTNLALMLLGIAGMLALWKGLVLWNGRRLILPSQSVIPLYFLFAVFLFAVWMVWPGFPLFSFFLGDHLLGDIRSLLFVSAGWVVSKGIWDGISRNRAAKALGWFLVFLVAAGWAFGETMKERDNVLTYPYDLPGLKRIEERVSMGGMNRAGMGNAIEQMNRPLGRVLVEDPYNRQVYRVRSHIFAAAPAFTNLELIGTGSWWFQTNDLSSLFSPLLLNGSGMNVSDRQMMERFDDYNVRYVVAFSRAFSDRLSRIPLRRIMQLDAVFPFSLADPGGLEGVGERGLAVANGQVPAKRIESGKSVVISWQVFEANVTPSMYKIIEGAVLESGVLESGVLEDKRMVDGIMGNATAADSVDSTARIEREVYQGTYSSAIVNLKNPSIVLFKVRYWPLWRASIDGSRADVRQTPQGLMEISVPAGRHEVVFAYKLRWIEWMSYILSMVGMLISSWVMWKNPGGEGSDGNDLNQKDPNR